MLSLAVVWGVGAAPVARAASYRPATPAERRSLSEAVFFGRVAGWKAGEGGGIAIEVEREVMGRLPSRVLVHALGAAGADGGLWSSGDSAVTAGSRYLFHAVVRPDGKLAPVGPPEPAAGWPSGFEKPEDGGAVSGADLRSRAATWSEGEALTGFHRAGPARRRVARSNSGQTGLTGFSIPADAEPFPSRLVTGDAGREIPYRVDATAWPAGLSLDEALGGVARAFAAWAEATGLRFRLDAVEDFGAAADGMREEDGIIRIQLHDLHGRIDDPLALAFGGLFAARGPLGSGYGGRVFDQEFHRTTGGYVIVNHRQEFLSDLRTLEEVLAHEIGHTLGLAHSSDSPGEADPERADALMFFRVHADGRGARIAPWDRQAARCAYPEGSSPPAAFPGILHAVTVAGGSQHLLPELLRVPVHRGPPGISSGGSPWSIRLFPAATSSHYGEFTAEGGDIVYHPLGFFEQAALHPSGGGFYDRAVYRVENGTHASAVESVRVLSLGRDGLGEIPDGLPDSWTTRWFGAGRVIDPGSDGDGDGCSERIEFQQDTDPTDPGSCVAVGFAVAALAVGESEAGFALELRCTTPPSRPLAVQWTWRGSSRFGEDYAVPESHATGAVLPAGVTRWVIPVQLRDDDLSEGPESLEVEISGVVGAALGLLTRVEVTIEDDEALPVYRFAAREHRTSEGAAGPLMVTVLRSGRTDAPSCVRVKARGAENAVPLNPAEDLGQVEWDVCFSAGETAATLALAPVDDGAQEPEEAGWLELEVVEGGGIVATDGAEASVVIEDNDGAPRVDLIAGEAREDALDVEVIARLSHPSGFRVVVSYALRDGSAKAGEDYVGHSGTIEVPAGETQGVARLALIDDGWSEGTEEFFFVVTKVENAEAGLRELAIRLQDDEAEPGVKLPVRVDAVEGGLLRVPVALTGAAAVIVEFSWQLVSRTAATRDDVPAEGGVIRFSPGETVQNLQLTLPDDALDEPVESVYLELTGRVHAQPGPFVTEVLLADDDPRPILRIDDLSVSEGAGVARFPVRLSAPSGFEITVQLSIVGGTATPGIDYQAAGGTLVLPPGAVEAVRAIPLVDDFLAEPDEAFEVRVGLVRNVTLDRAKASVFILDDDPPNALTMRAGPVIEGAVARVEILRSTPTDTPATVRYRTRAETAVAPGDFADTAGEAVILAGASSVFVEIPVVSDSVDEEDETFRLEFATSAGLAVVGAPFFITILDDDDPPELTALAGPTSEGAGLSPVLVQLRISAPSERRIAGRIEPAGGAAVAGEDYLLEDPTFVILPGEMETAVTVIIVDDARAEETETAFFEVRSLENASDAGARPALVIADNDELPAGGALLLEFADRRIPEIRWRGRQGGRYHVELSRDLREWQRLLPAPVAATGLWESQPLPDVATSHWNFFLRLARSAPEAEDAERR